MVSNPSTPHPPLLLTKAASSLTLATARKVGEECPPLNTAMESAHHCYSENEKFIICKN
jgi:hypothetical protein